MGLDAVEIVMEVEAAFDIELEDDEAMKVETPGGLIDCVVKKVGRREATACLTQRSFNLLRAALLRELPLKRKDVFPAASLATLIPEPDRLRVLERLASALGTGPFPALVRPRWLVRVLIGAAVAMGIGLAVVLRKLVPGMSPGSAITGGFLAMPVVGFIAQRATRRWAIKFPPTTATVGDLARFVMAHKRDLGAAGSPGWTREQVAARVREIVIEHLNCADIYREDASFIQDLGMS